MQQRSSMLQIQMHISWSSKSLMPPGNSLVPITVIRVRESQIESRTRPSRVFGYDSDGVEGWSMYKSEGRARYRRPIRSHTLVR